MPQLPAYPPILTQMDWNSKKGVVAKIVAVPTQLGDALKKVETAFKEVEWHVVFDAPPPDIHKVNERLVTFGGTFKGQYMNFKQAVQVAKVQAKNVKDAWDKNKLIPSASKTHLDNLYKTFDLFFNHVETEMKAAHNVLAGVQQGLAKLNPNEAAKSNQGATQVVTKSPNAPKTEGIKTKFKPQPVPQKPGKSESEESEKESTE